MRKEIFIDENIYHIYNRGVEKRITFAEDCDYIRFLKCLYLLNDQNSNDYDISNINIQNLILYKRNPLVNILHWTLMPNHFHLLLQQKIDGGISAFMQKIGTSYTMYFNKKNERNGCLFQGRFKAKFIKDDSYLTRIVSYIPLNPLKFQFSDWKNNLDNINFLEAKKILSNYKWTSFNDYFSKELIPELTSKKELLKFFDNDIKKYEHYMMELLRG